MKRIIGIFLISLTLSLTYSLSSDSIDSASPRSLKVNLSKINLGRSLSPSSVSRRQREKITKLDSIVRTLLEKSVEEQAAAMKGYPDVIQKFASFVS